MTAIQKINTMPSIQEMTQITEMCRVLATSPYYKNMGAGGVLSIWLTAREMGLPPMMCLNGGMYTFSGAVSLSAGLMNYLITSAGHRVEVIVLNEEGCTLKFIRGDRAEGQGDSMEYSFTKKDAERAGYLRKKNWLEHPRDMMFNRCLSGGARKYMPDAIMGAYIEGEIEKTEPKEYNERNYITETTLTVDEVAQITDQSPQIEESITPEQIVDMLELLKRTNEDYRTKFYNHLKNTYGDKSLALIPRKEYNKFITSLENAVNLIEKEVTA